MFEPIPEMAPDLEWMLQSGQAPREILAEALVHEYYAGVYHLALLVLDDTNAARRATRNAFGAALLSAYRYREQDGIQAWLYSIVIETLQKALKQFQRLRALKASLPFKHKPTDFGLSTPETERDAQIWLEIDAMPEVQRITLLLYLVQGWNTEQLARLHKIHPDDAATQLRNLRLQLFSALWEDLQAEANNRLDNLDVIVQRSLAARWTAPQFTEAELNEATRSAVSQAQRQQWSRRSLTVGKELAVVAIVVLCVTSLLWGSGQVWPDPTATPWPTPPPEDTALPEATVGLPQPGARQLATQDPNIAPQSSDLYDVNIGDTLYSVAEDLHIDAVALARLNRLALDSALRPGQLLMIPRSPMYGATPIATPVTPIPPGTLQLQETAISPDALLSARAGQTFFHTLWMDARILDYGPLGYIGPPRVTRVQTWLSQDQGLVLVGSLNSIQEAWLQVDEHFYLARPGIGQPWFLDTVEPETSNFKTTLENFYKVIFDFEAPPSDVSMQTKGKETLAGKETLMIDLLTITGRRLTRFWLDTRTGLTLRKLAYTETGLQELVQEITIDRIVYDVNLPQDLFDPTLPWRGGYALDESGQPAADSPLAASNPDAQRQRLRSVRSSGEIDVSSRQLFFQYPASYLPDGRAAVVQIFADKDLLGSILLGDPWEMICARSPDGLSLAAAFSASSSVDTFLHWFRLDQTLLSDNTYFLDTTPHSFTFSPDGRSLAVFGKLDSLSQMGELYLLDTENKDNVRPLIALANARSLVWSPDGQHLAFIARYQADSFNENVVVIQIDNAKTIYSKPLDLSAAIDISLPTLQWGVTFPVEMGGMENCVMGK